MKLFNHLCLEETFLLRLDEAVGIASTTIKVVGVTSISVNDLVNIDNEILEIKNVGFGSTNVLKVERGVLGSVASCSHGWWHVP